MKKMFKRLAIFVALIVVARTFLTWLLEKISASNSYVLFNTLDFDSAWQQLKDYGTLVLHRMIQS